MIRRGYDPGESLRSSPGFSAGLQGLQILHNRIFFLIRKVRSVKMAAVVFAGLVCIVAFEVKPLFLLDIRVESKIFGIKNIITSVER